MDLPENCVPLNPLVNGDLPFKNGHSTVYADIFRHTRPDCASIWVHGGYTQLALNVLINQQEYLGRSKESI